MANRRYKTGPGASRITQARKPPAIIPGLGVDVPELQRARTLWCLNRFDEALQLFEHAVEKAPSKPRRSD
jgi:hypothetical protein